MIQPSMDEALKTPRAAGSVARPGESFEGCWTKWRANSAKPEGPAAWPADIAGVRRRADPVFDSITPDAVIRAVSRHQAVVIAAQRSYRAVIIPG